MKIATKLYLLVTGTVAAFTVLIAMGSGYVAIRQSYTNIDKRGMTLCLNVAHNSQFGVLFTDKESLMPLLEGVMIENDIVNCQILDRNGVVIAEKSRNNTAGPTREYVAPIIIDKSSSYREELKIFNLTQGDDEDVQIGTVQIAMSLRTVRNENRNFILVLLVVLILAALLSYACLALILRAVFVRPIELLETATKKISQGDLNYKVKLISPDEFGSLAAAINKMTDDLKETTVSKEYMDNIFESTTISFIVTDTKGIIKRVNKATAELSGYKPDELIGSPISILLSDDGLRRWSQIESFNNLDVIRNVEGPFLTKDKRSIPVLFASAVMRDIYHQTIGIVCSARDITDRKRIEVELKNNFEKLQQMMTQVVVSLASAVEMRDPYTAGHQRRVAQLATKLAKEMGLPDDQCQGLNMASLIHDIGKLYIPAEILSRPSQLDDQEYNLIKYHSEMGYEILKTIDFPWPVAEMIYQHHERLDGSGYPRGLKAEAIIPEAKILIVADVMEAMISHRPYRPAISIKSALDELQKNKGILYDPVVVDACTVLFQEKDLKLD